MDLFKQLREAVGIDKITEPVARLNQLAKTVEALRSLLKDNMVSEKIKQRINGLMTLVTTRPNITGINHYFNHFLLQLEPEDQIPVLKELLEVYHERWKNIERRTANVAYEHLKFEDEPALLIHGAERSIIALLELLNVHQHDLTIYQTLSRPSEEGRLQAERIAAMGFTVNFIDDHAIGQILSDIDYVLTGCDVILPNEFINHAGTHTLLAAAHYYKRPIYVLGDSRRILNSKYFTKNVLTALIGDGKGNPDDLWKKAPENVKVIQLEKEQIPNYIIEKFILEDGVYDPEELKSQIDKVMVSKFF